MITRKHCHCRQLLRASTKTCPLSPRAKPQQSKPRTPSRLQQLRPSDGTPPCRYRSHLSHLSYRRVPSYHRSRTLLRVSTLTLAPRRELEQKSVHEARDVTNQLNHPSAISSAVCYSLCSYAYG